MPSKRKTVKSKNIEVDNTDTPIVEDPKIKKVKKTPVKKIAKPAKKQDEKALEKEPTEKKTTKRVSKKMANEEEPKKLVDKVERVFKPKAASSAGLNIPIARVKKIIANIALNAKESNAIKEIKLARGKEAFKRIVKDKETGKNITIQYPKIDPKPIDSLSTEILDFLETIKKPGVLADKRIKFGENKVKNMAENVRMNYNKLLAAAKVSHAAKMDDEKQIPFDIIAFNISFDKTFYADFVDDDEYKKASDLISKTQIRFSANAKVFLAAFLELLIRQLSMNGIHSCAADDKKIIQVNHAIDMTKDRLTDRFPLYPIILSTNTFRNITADGVVAENAPKQCNFRFYVGAICQEMNITMGTDKTDEPSHNNIKGKMSIGNMFKIFGSELIFELLMRIGKMLETEVITRAKKTVSDSIVQAVIEHIHHINGIDVENTLKFINQHVDIYAKYMSEKASNSKKNEDMDETSTDDEYDE